MRKRSEDQRIAALVALREANKKVEKECISYSDSKLALIEETTLSLLSTNREIRDLYCSGPAKRSRLQTNQDIYNLSVIDSLEETLVRILVKVTKEMTRRRGGNPD